MAKYEVIDRQEGRAVERYAANTPDKEHIYRGEYAYYNFYMVEVYSGYYNKRPIYKIRDGYLWKYIW